MDWKKTLKNQHLHFFIIYILLIATEFCLFFSVNLITHIKGNFPWLIVFELPAAFLLFLMPLIPLSLLNFTKAVFPNKRQRNWAIYGTAIVMFSIQMFYQSNRFPTNKMTTFKTQFFQCTPYTPWPLLTDSGQKLTESFYQGLPNKMKYAWYNLEDACRINKVKRDFVDIFPSTPKYCAGKTRHDCLLDALYYMNDHSPLSTPAMVNMVEMAGQRTIKEKNYLLLNQGQITDREKVQIILESAFQLMDLAIWANYASYYSTVDLKIKNFPKRKIASIGSKQQKLLAHHLVSTSEGGDIFSLLFRGQTSAFQKQSGLDLVLWENAKLKVLDHFLRDEMSMRNEKFMKSLNIKAKEQIKAALDHKIFSKADHLFYENELNIRAQRLGLKRY